MILVAGCALLAVAGMALIAVGLAPRRPSLTAELDRLLPAGGYHSGGLRPGPAARSPISPPAMLEAAMAAVWGVVDPGGDRFPALTADLAVTEHTPVWFVRQLATAVTVLPLIAVMLFAALRIVGIHLPVSAGLIVAVFAAAVGATLPRPTLHSEADKRRAEMREVVAAICDLAAVLLAGTEDVDSAIVTAAAAGEGWAFDAVRRALPRTIRQGVWQSLAALGERFRVEELTTLAQNMGLAEQQGAKVRDALNSQAKSLRDIVIAEVETKAGAATDTMSLPLALLGIGFMVLIAYPSLARF